MHNTISMKTLINLLKAPQSEKLAYIGIVAAFAAFAGFLGVFGGWVGLAAGTLISAGTVAALLFLLRPPASSPEPERATAATDEPPPPVTFSADRIDELTGLANENGLMAWFGERGKRIAEDGHGIIVLSADLAEFERIERAHGQKVADQVLVEVARRVATCTGADGIAARTGGDEFAAVATVVPRNSAEITEEQAGKLAELLQRPVELPGAVIWIGGSVGASFGEVGRGKEILEEARTALKRATKLGRGHYVIYRPDMKA